MCVLLRSLLVSGLLSLSLARAVDYIRHCWPRFSAPALYKTFRRGCGGGGGARLIHLHPQKCWSDYIRRRRRRIVSLFLVLARSGDVDTVDRSPGAAEGRGRC